MREYSVLHKSLLWLLTLLLALFIIFPFWYMIVMSVSSNQAILSNNVDIIPTSFYFGNIVSVITKTALVRSVFNTILVAAVILFFQIVTCELAAFAFAFMEFKGKKLLFFLVISTMMVPGEATIVANYLTLSAWHMIDTYQVLIVPFLTSAMGIFLIRQFFLTLPHEIQEAAMLDGCSNTGFLAHIATPLAKPILGSFGIISFLDSWNRYMWPLLVTNNENMRMVQVTITQLKDADAAVTIGLALAGASIVTIPSIFVFMIGHRQLISGITAGAVKG